ncbi:MAG: PD40 domain-containing protein [Saprospiraceae bacterium]|nr:PD40 domain-containing protein [Saprospiraceae bacterium]
MFLKIGQVIIFVCFCHFLTVAQNTPQIINSKSISGVGEFGFTCSPNEKIALWVKSGGKRDTLVIMQANKVKGKWSTPKLASFSNNGQWKDIDPIFSPDGKVVYFQSNRPRPDGTDANGFDIWAVKLLGNQWAEPYHLGMVLNTDSSESYASVASNGNLYFMKENENKQGNSDIYISKFTNYEYQLPTNVGLPINTLAFRESNPFIAPDESYIIYFSSDTTGFGEVDLFISFHEHGKWSTPKNLGHPINSTVAEFCPFVNKKKLYFTRQEKGPDRMIEHIYSVDFDPNLYK